jgi:hypothetical protein
VEEEKKEKRNVMTEEGFPAHAQITNSVKCSLILDGWMAGGCTTAAAACKPALGVH